MNAFAVVLPLTALLTTALCWPAPTATPQSNAPQTHVETATLSAPLPAQGLAPTIAAPAAPTATVPAKAYATFPDGSRRPALNGVTSDVVMPWPGGGPFSPIVEVVTHQGQQWFRHADGTASTTVRTKDQISGRDVVVPMCCRPEPVMRALQSRR